ncbi:hypothetical protein [Pontiella sp.]|uniref:hypothetical protein n=1 Tax=Pontiella sp. TaxID=2837462 RepID=UPI003561A6F8
MKGGTSKANIDVSIPYREETVKIPAIISIVAVLLVAAPLVFWIYTINAEGAKSTDIARYEHLIASVKNDAAAVDAMLRNDAVELARINAMRKKPVVTLVVPEVVIVEEKKGSSNSQDLLSAELEGIFWHPSNPLACINGDTYRIGDKVQGYEIVRIGKESVRFKALDGTITQLNMYENLFKKKK